MGKYAIGVDFGTASGRVVVVNVENGEVAGVHETIYKHGIIDHYLPNSNISLKKDTALQHPQDYIDVLQESIPMGIKKAGVHSKDIIGVGLDFTSCTILPVDETLVPLCFKNKWRKHPHAWVKLWKHHAAQPQADKINALAKKKNQPWLKRYGGVISSEWMLPKVMEILEEDSEVYHETAYFMEAVDWLTSLLTGSLQRSSCTTGFKGIWNKESGYLEPEFLRELHPQLKNIYEDKLSGKITPIGKRAGVLTAEFSQRIGLEEGTPIAMGMIDAHAGVPGSGVTSSNKMVMVMGTSTCHMLLSNHEQFVDGISGVVENGIIPNLFAYEAGQAAVGDIFAWFTKENVPAYVKENADKENKSIHEYFETLASKLNPGSNGLLALDWHNGCRTPLVDANLSGALIGLTLSTKPEEIYRSLLESTAYGTKMVIEQFQKKGIEISELVACGGLPRRNKLLMQIYADVTGMPIKITNNTLTSAVGSAIYGAVAAGSENGGYDDVSQAAQNMTSLKDHVYLPNKEKNEKYSSLYHEYVKLVDYFGKGKNNVMKYLKKLE